MELAVSDQFTKVANSPRRLFITFVVLMLVASVGYSVVESTGFLDAIYWAIITATTLGYGDFSPHTGAGKVLTIGLKFDCVHLHSDDHSQPGIEAHRRSRRIHA